MALVDLEGNYKSAPPKLTYTPKPDPFANYVDETGSLSTANYQGWGTPAPTTVSAPAASPTGNKWNSQYQAWEDPSGNLWDSASGTWYDPDSGKVWSSNTNSWQTPQQYAATWDAILGHDQAISNTLGSQPSGQATYAPDQSAWRAFDRNNGLAPTGEFQQPRQTLSDLLMGGVNSIKTGIAQAQQPESYGFTPVRQWNPATSTFDVAPNRMPTSLDLERQGRGGQISSQLGTIATQGASSGLAGRALGAANKYFFDPFAETGAQLTPSFLKTMGAQTLGPSFDLASQASRAFGGYDIDKGEKAGISELGTALRQSGGNPLKFGELQQENLYERPLWQQRGAQALYDPTNLIGAGIGGKALKTGIKGEGLLSDILRGAARVDKGIDAFQARTLSAGLKYGGREALGAGFGAGANQLAGGKDATGLEWWQAGALGALGGNVSRGAKGSLPGRAADTIARAQGRTGLAPALGGQIDDVSNEVTRRLDQIFGELDEFESSRGIRGPRLLSGLSKEDRNYILTHVRANTPISEISYGEPYLALGSTATKTPKGIYRTPDGAEVTQVRWWEFGAPRQTPPNQTPAHYLAEEGGAVPTKLALKGGATAGFGAFGYATADEDASIREKWTRALGFAAIPAIGPEATDIVAKLYGKAPGLAKHGIGRNSVLETAPEAAALVEAGVTPPIRLPEYRDVSSLPLPTHTRISNATWDAIGQNNMNLKANIDRPEVFYPMESFQETRGRIPLVADDMAKTYGNDYLRLVEIDADGYQLGANGQRMPALEPNGRIRTVPDPKMPEAQVPVMAGPRDVSNHVDWYETNGYITPEVAQAIRRLAAMTDEEISPALRAFKIMPDPEPNVGADGVFISRGQTQQKKVPRFRRERAVDNKKPNSFIKQEWKTEGEALLAGYRYDHPVEAMRKLAREQLDALNKANLATNLSYVKLEAALSGDNLLLGDLRLDREAQAELDNVVKDIKETKREIKKLTTRKTRVDRDARMAGRWVEVNGRRIRSLLNTAADQSLQSAARRTAAQDAYTLARQSYDDAESAAREYFKGVEKIAGKRSVARADLAETLADARKAAREAEKVLKGGVAAEQLDNLSYVTDTWAHADSIRAAVAADIERIADNLAAMPLAERQATEQALKGSLDKAKSQFGDSLSELRKQRKAGEVAAQRETRAVENVRARISQGKADELEAVVQKRANELKKTLSYSQELQGKIDELQGKLLPLKQHKREVSDILKRSQVFRRELKESGIPTGTIDVVGGWEGVPVPIEIANAVNKYKLTPGPQRKLPAALLSAYDLVNDLFRFMGATADFSRTAIQGLLGIGENPEITRKGLAATVKTLKDPQYEFTYLKNLEAQAIKEGLGSIAHAVGRGLLEIAHNEYLFRGITDENSTLAKLAKIKPFSWFETMFSTPGNVERLERYYDYMRVAKATGQDVTDVRVMRDAAAAANMVTGRSSHGLLAPVIGERGSSRVLFAGRFVQSQLETLYSALMVGGIEGEVARRSLLRLGLGGAALTYMINKAQGEKTDWRLFVDGMPNPNWARIRVFGHDVSIFGSWDSLVKGALAVYQRDPGSFLRSKMAPAAGMAYDLSMGKWETPMGEKIGLNMDTLNQYSPTPFGLTDTIRQGINKTDWHDAGSIGELAAAAVLNFGGFKNSPLTPRERYNRELAEAYPKWEAKDADGNAIAYQRPADPLHDPLFLREYAAAHPDSVPGPASALGKEMRAERDRWSDAIQKNNSTFAEDGRTLGEWKAIRHDLKLQQRTALKPIFDKMKSAFGDKEPEPGTPAAWLDSYMKTFEQATVDQVVDPALLDKFQAEWLEANGPTAQDYINQFFLAGTDPGPEREYLKATQQLDRDGYFDGRIPRYIGLSGSISDDEIDKARRIIAGRAEAHPELEGANYDTKALVILRPLGYSLQQIYDISDAGKEKYEHPRFTIYKRDNPGLVEWLDDGNFYSTLQAVSSR